MMTTMINTSAAVDGKTALGNEAVEKENGGDQFQTLMAGLFAPQEIKQPPPAPENVEVPGENFVKTYDDAAQPAPGFCMSPGDIALPTKKEQEIANSAKTPDVMLPENAIEAPPANGLSGRTCMDLGVNVPSFKPVVKELKTQAFRFDQAAPEPGPIAHGGTVDAMQKLKASIVEQLNATQAPVNFEPAATAIDTASDVAAVTTVAEASPFEFAQVIDQKAPVVREISRKFIKLFSDISESFGVDNNAAVKAEIAEVIEQQPVAAKAKMILEQVAPKVLEIAAAVVAGEKQIMKMRLHPAELGTVEIHLEKDASGVLSARFNTDNDVSRQILEKNLAQLRESLQNAGWQVGQMDTASKPSSDNGAGSRQAFQHGQQSQQPGGQPHAGGDRNGDSRTKSSNARVKDQAERLVSLQA